MVKLSPELMAEAVEARRIHGSDAAAAVALGIRRSTFQGRLAAAKIAAVQHAEEPAQSAEPMPTNAFEAEWRIFQREIGMARDRYTGPCKRPARIGRRKILVVPDVHAPFHDRAMVATMLEREKDADHAVVMGDIGDGYAFSRFIKYESVPYEQELAAVEAVLEQLSERYPEVDVIEGNHDAPRLERQLRERLTPDMVSAIIGMTGGTLSPIEALCKRRFPNVRLASHMVGRHECKWFTQIGDAIFCHAEKFSRVPGAALRSVEEWFSDNERKLALKPWRVVVMAHTHQFGVYPWRSDKLLVECGCLATTPGYALGAKVGGRPQRGGYVTLDQTDGWTDFSSVRMVHLDQDDKPEPEVA